MKTTHRSLYRQIAAFVVALSFGVSAYAESPRQELAHAYVLLKLANNNYGGHRTAALKELEVAGKELGIDLNGPGSKHEQQLKSDQLVAESGRILHAAREKLDARDRDHVAGHVDVAIHEIDEALRVK